MGSYETLAHEHGEARAYGTGEDTPDRRGVVVLHAWWGLVQDVVAFADDRAAQGVFVVAPDLVGGRTADTIEGAEDIVNTADEAIGDAVALAAVDRGAGR